MRGLPSGVYSRRCDVERLALRSTRAKPGEASRLLSAIASSSRSFAGKKVSRSNTPTLSNGGFWIAPDQARRGRGRAARSRRRRASSDSRMCSRLRSGSASMPTSASRPETAAAMRSRSASASRRSPRAAAANERRSGQAAGPRRCPACRSRHPPASRKRAMRSPSWPHSASPLLPGLGRLRGAYSSGVVPCARASAGSIQGAKSAARSRGNVSSRLPRSPLGSIAIAGMPSMRRLLEQREAEAGLAAAGHADADRVRRQVPRVVEQRLVGQRILAGRSRAEVEAPSFSKSATA